MTPSSTPRSKRLDWAAEDLSALPGVVDVALLTDDPRTEDSTLSLTVGPEYERVPPRVLRTLATHDLGIVTCQPQGSPAHHILLAV